MIRDPYAPRPLAPSERKCLDLAAALAARFVLHYAGRCGPSGRHKPARLEAVTVHRATLAAQIADCERRYPRPAPPQPVVVSPPAAPQPAAAVIPRAAPAVCTTASRSTATPARTAITLAAAAPAASSWSAVDDDVAGSYYYSDDDDTSTSPCGWNPCVNIDGTPMIYGTCIDVHGHAFGAVSWEPPT